MLAFIIRSLEILLHNLPSSHSQMKVQLDNLEIALIRPAFSSFSLLLSSFSWESACIGNWVQYRADYPGWQGGWWLVTLLPGQSGGWRCWLARIGNESIMSINCPPPLWLIILPSAYPPVQQSSSPSQASPLSDCQTRSSEPRPGECWWFVCFN